MPGVTVTVEGVDSGLSRTAVSNSSGGYRFAGLPTGRYELTAVLEGFATHRQQLQVGLGVTVDHPVKLAIGAFSGSIEVGGTEPVVDTTSSHSGTNLDVGLLDALLPLNHDTTQIAILVPGTVPGDQAFDPVSQACATGACGSTGWGTPGQALLSIDGGSIAENLYVVDGLNISNFSQGLGSSFIPMAFVDEVQVKQGGLEAEFGRTTGGVVNMITKSGTNSLHGNAAALWSPESLQEQSPSVYNRDFAHETRRQTEVTASVGGPLARDRLFYFLFLRYLDTDSTALPNNSLHLFAESSPYWGGKLDWSVSARHRLEATYISDGVRVDVQRLAVDTETGEDRLYDGVMNRGGDNAILHYTGVLRDNLLLSAQVGRSGFDRYDGAETDECPVALDGRFSQPEESIGCWVDGRVGSWIDPRGAVRADVDWFVGNHSLRAGVDYEQAASNVDHRYSGGVAYLYDWAGRYPYLDHLPSLTEVVFAEILDNVGSLEVESTAAYAQDSWAVTENLTLNFGLRWETYEHRNAHGGLFLEVENQLAPRFGFVWDPQSDGRSKLYASLGRFHLPYPTQASVEFAGALTLTEDAFLLEGGINPDGSPEELGEHIWSGPQWVDDVPENREVSADSIDPASQRELVLGFERLVGTNWRLGVRGVARQYEAVIEEVYINQALWEVYGVPCFDPSILGSPDSCPDWLGQRIANPGQDFDGWYDLDADGELDPISMTAEEMGFPEPKRDYYAVELVGSRHFADNWLLEASYVWSHSYGNYEGLVSSDLRGQANAGLTRAFDWPGMMDHGSGNLPNDRRHFGRVYGAYSWPSGLGVGGSFFVQSGRPINSFGRHPTDPYAQFYGYPAFYTGGEPTPRGTMGRTDTLWWLDLTARYDWRMGKTNLYVRVDAFNVFDNQGISKVDELGEDFTEAGNLEPYPYWGEPLYYQSPRSVRFGLGVSF